MGVCRDTQGLGFPKISGPFLVASIVRTYGTFRSVLGPLVYGNYH